MMVTLHPSMFSINTLAVTPVEVVQHGSKPIPSYTQTIHLCIAEVCHYICVSLYFKTNALKALNHCQIATMSWAELTISTTGHVST